VAKRISQEEWDRRALALGLKWVDKVGRNDRKVLSACLRCGAEALRLPSNVAKGQGCASCARQKSRSTPAHWQELASRLGFEWVGGTPELVSDRTKIGRCLGCGKSWKVSPSALYAGRGHPRCPAKTRNSSLRISFEEWQKRAKKQGLVFLEPPLNSRSPTLAECLSCGHNWRPRPVNVSHLGSGCPVCRLGVGQKKRKQDDSTLAGDKAVRYVSKARDQRVEWLGDPPLRLHQRHRARCVNCANEWEPWVSNVVTKGTGCPVCARNSSIPQSEWDRRAAEVNLKWLASVTGRHSKCLAMCLLCGHEQLYEPGAVAGGHGCPKCGAETASRNQRLASKVWQSRAAAKGLRWIELPGNNSEKRLIECLACSHSWNVIPASLSGCPTCSGTFVSETEWERRASAKGLRWVSLPEGSREPTEAGCLSCGLTWVTTPDSIARGSGCPDCAETGFKPGKPAYLYFLEDTERGARKIGISNIDAKNTRLNAHRRNGFGKEIFILSGDLGFQIAELEMSVMAWLRVDCRLPQYLDKQDMPQRGWTETFSTEGPSNLEVIAKIKELAEKIVQL
jgi:hypothetical protein